MLLYVGLRAVGTLCGVDSGECRVLLVCSGILQHGSAFRLTPSPNSIVVYSCGCLWFIILVVTLVRLAAGRDKRAKMNQNSINVLTYKYQIINPSSQKR